MKRWLVYLKTKWNIKSNFQLFLIFVVFGLTGSFSLKLAKPVLYYFGFSREIFNNLFLGDIFYWSLRLINHFSYLPIALTFFLVLFFSVFFFFWELEKKILIKIGFGKFFSNTKK